MRLKDGDDQILIAAKLQVEKKFKNDRWGLIAAEMESKGADKYPIAFLEKKYRELIAERPVANGAGGEDDDGMGE